MRFRCPAVARSPCVTVKTLKYWLQCRWRLHTPHEQRLSIQWTDRRVQRYTEPTWSVPAIAIEYNCSRSYVVHTDGLGSTVGHCLGHVALPRASSADAEPICSLVEDIAGETRFCSASSAELRGLGARHVPLGQPYISKAACVTVPPPQR